MKGFEICRENWRKLLVADEQILSNPNLLTKKRLEEVSEKTEQIWNELKRNLSENTVALFRDTAIKESVEMTEEYETLRELTKGYATFGTKFYKNEELLKDILWALDWMNRHYYGKAESGGNGWRSYYEFNWYDWNIDTPQRLMDIMVLLYEHLTAEQISEYLFLFEEIVSEPHDFASNKLMFGKVIICSGLLQNNADRVLCGRDGIADCFTFSDGGKNFGQGFFRDGSYIFHTHHPQNALYGMEHLQGAINIAAILKDSDFSLKMHQQDILYYWFENSFMPFYYKGSIMRIVCGRYPETELSRGYQMLKNAVNLYDLGNRVRKEKLASFIKKAVEEHPKIVNNECKELFNQLTLNEYMLLSEIFNKDTEKYISQKSFKVFNCQDRAVFTGEDYAVAIGMSSSRIYNYECINHKNLNGWYHGDGSLWIYKAPLQYDKVYFENVDPYRIKGTTVDNRQRAKVSIAQRNEYLSSQDFVGSLSAGDTGISAMQLESYHSNGKLICEDYYLETGEYGSAPPKHDSTLMAKKSYFFLRDCIVCLGADINSSDNAPVYTVLDNKKQDYLFKNGETSGFKQTEIKINGKVYTPSDTDKKVNAEFISIDDEEIYLFGEREVTICQKGNEPYFTEILLQHGTNPQNETYEYAVLPYGKNKKPNIEILANNKKIQAIRDLDDGALYCVFWESGAIAGIKANKPMIVCLKSQKIYACDVTQKLKNAEIQINGKYYSFNFENKEGKAIEKNENDFISR